MLLIPPSGRSNHRLPSSFQKKQFEMLWGNSGLIRVIHLLQAASPPSLISASRPPHLLRQPSLAPHREREGAGGDAFRTHQPHASALCLHPNVKAISGATPHQNETESNVKNRSKTRVRLMSTRNRVWTKRFLRKSQERGRKKEKRCNKQTPLLIVCSE